MVALQNTAKIQEMGFKENKMPNKDGLTLYCRRNLLNLDLQKKGTFEQILMRHHEDKRGKFKLRRRIQFWSSYTEADLDIHCQPLQ